MRTVESYRGLLVYVLEPGEEVPSWVRSDVQQGRGVMAVGEFKSTAALAHILDRYIDEMLRTEAGGPSAPTGGYTQSRNGPR
ncbi:MAG TPA: hypothetical protein VFC93_11545 [Chloroflexota bacterium]|nr:hypothetical protein [Chloroflexota bacterium]